MISRCFRSPCKKESHCSCVRLRAIASSESISRISAKKKGKQLCQWFGGRSINHHEVRTDGRLKGDGQFRCFTWRQSGKERVERQEEKESCRKIRITRRHYPRGQNDGSWKFQALKCGPDKSRHQGPHPFSIQTRRKVAYPLGASILSTAFFFLLPLRSALYSLSGFLSPSSPSRQSREWVLRRRQKFLH